MDEKIPPLATYPPPRKPREKGMSVGVQRALFALGGLLVGGGLVLATMKMTAPPQQPVASQLPLTRSNERGDAGPGHAGPDSNPNSDPGQAPGSNPAATNPSGSNSPGSSTPGDAKSGAPAGGVPPYNPFEGNITVPMPTSEMSGHISAGPPPEVPNHQDPGKPVSGGTTSPANQTPANQTSGPVDEAPKGYLVTIRLDVQDPESAVQAIQGVAAKLGGSAIQFDETASHQDPEGALIFVPAAKAEDAKKALGGVGSVVVSDTWTGSAGARLDRIENDAQNHLSDLRIKRQELLVKYFEDAPQIKHIDEDAERINHCIAALRAKKPGLDTAVLKIKFLS